jgi:hypothetical protein
VDAAYPPIAIDYHTSFWGVGVRFPSHCFVYIFFSLYKEPCVRSIGHIGVDHGGYVTLIRDKHEGNILERESRKGYGPYLRV